MPLWTERKRYYYAYFYHDDESLFIPKWKIANSLYEAIMEGKRIVMRDNEKHVWIQTKPINEYIGPRIPKHVIGDVSKYGKKGPYVYSHYIANSFNKSPCIRDYIIKGNQLIEWKEY